MARVTHVHTIVEVAKKIGENLEFIEVVSANSDNIGDGEMIWIDDGTEEGIKADNALSACLSGSRRSGQLMQAPERDPA